MSNNLHVSEGEIIEGLVERMGETTQWSEIKSLHFAISNVRRVARTLIPQHPQQSAHIRGNFQQPMNQTNFGQPPVSVPTQALVDYSSEFQERIPQGLNPDFDSFIP